jgi:predicted cupin superfamily sugar epimerase
MQSQIKTIIFMKNKTAQYWIKRLELQPHPEGGYYKEVYRSEESVDGKLLPGNRDGVRSVSTAIYFLLEGNDFSAFHRIKSDEIWHFYDGAPLMIYAIDKEGKLNEYPLGVDSPMQIIPKEEWFAAELIDKSSYALVGCTVAPGFDFADFEMGNKEVLINTNPQFQEIINRLSL